jgi:hypothetical protein
MTKYLAGVLSVIAVGVLLIAYGLLNPRGMTGFEPAMRPMPVSESIALPTSGAAYQNGTTPYGYVPAGYVPAGYVPAGYVPATNAAPGYGYVPYGQPMVMQAPEPRAVRTVSAVSQPAPRRVARSVERERGRDWKKTAMIIGGSTAAGAGLGGIFGGKKGALIGAAIGGGASTIYETTK